MVSARRSLLIAFSILIVMLTIFVLIGRSQTAGFGPHFPISGGAGTPLTACGNISTAGAYYLANSVTCPGVAFSVTANGAVTVNLNGNTVTYGNSPQTFIVAGFLQIACYETLWTNGTGAAIDTITATALTSNVATITANNTFSAGQEITISGTTNGGGIFNNNWYVLSANSTSFTFSFPHANVASASDSGTVHLAAILQTGSGAGACNPKSTFSGVTVYGGNIVQGCTPATTCLPQDSNGVFCDSYFSGNGACLSGPAVYGVDFTWAAGNSLAVSANYGNNSVTGGASIHDDTFNNNKNGPVCAMVSCRESLQGTSVIIGNAVATSVAPQFYNNQCYGGPQGCMMSDALNASFTNNPDINPGAASVEYTNDFGIYAWACGDTVTGNTIGTNPPTGNQATRGISIDLVEFPSGCAGNTTVSSNTVNVITSTNNAEYGGCSIGGVYGIQIDDGGMNASITNNTVNAFSKSCAASGLRLTQLGTGNTSSGNTFSAHIVSGSGFVPSAEYPTTGVYIDGEPSFPAFTSTNDTFLGDGSAIAFDYNGSGPITLSHCTLGSGTNPAAGFVTVSYWNGGGTSTQTYLQDCTFTGLATKTLTNMQVGNGAPYDLAQYFVQWTYSGTVTGFLSGSPVSGAAVTVTASAGAGSGTECSTTTNASGQFSCTLATALTELDMKNSTTVAQINTNHNPHSVVVSKSGCTTNTSSLSITSTTTGASIVLGGC
jgi:hypothetical protein